jgi:lipopolysaccharide transport system permease protein
MAWHGDVKFLYKQLILKDFKIRYRNMSLGVLWSLLNPLVMMGVLTFIFPHLLIQLALLMVMALAYGSRPGLDWLWLIVVWILEIAFVCGLSLIFAGLNVFVQDTRYFVESANTVLFWMVPIFYPFSAIPPRFAGIYEINPVAAIVLAMQNILLQNHAPSLVLVIKLALVSTFTIAIGHVIFRSMERNFYQHL